MSALSGGIQVMGNYIAQKAQAGMAQQHMDAQAKAHTQQMNYAFQNYEQERTDSFDRAVDELTQIKHNSMQLNSAVKSAVYEDMGNSRTSDLLLRSVEGDTARSMSAVKDTYTRKSNEIDLNKEANLISTKTTIDNINASAPQMPSKFTNFLTTAGVALDVTNKGLNQKDNVISKGYEYNWFTGGAGRKDKRGK